MRLRFKNWKKYQHYKDRNPPWIKLHSSILTSESWILLDDASRLLAMVCMILASRNDGDFLADAAFIKRAAYLTTEPNFKKLIDSGFCEIVKTEKTNAELETDTESETETELLANASNVLASASNVLASTEKKAAALTAADIYNFYPRKVGRPKAIAAIVKAIARDGSKVDLMERTKAFAAACAGREQQFIPHPATWFNQERYNDDPSTWNPVEKAARRQPTLPNIHIQANPDQAMRSAF